MTIQQLSLFLENKPSAMRVPTKALAEAGINILTIGVDVVTDLEGLRA